jgi:PKD repeat protein
VNRAPTLAQPADMTVDEGATADQVLSATDPDGNALTFTKVSGPLYLTVTTTSPTTGNAHLAPGFSDAGAASAVVRASDGSLSDQKSFNITVNNVNRAPTANADGPYNGTVNNPVSFDGTGSSDPDGDALTYAWDFGDTGTGTGATSSHTYTAEGTFTVTLTVTDNGVPALSDTDETTATITDRVPATVFPSSNSDFKPKSGKPRYCFQIEPVNGSFNLSDVDLSSIVILYLDRQAGVEVGRTIINSDANLNGIQEIQACFTKASLVTLFAGLGGGKHDVTVALEGNLVSGGRFHGETTWTVRGPVNGSAAPAAIAPNPLNPSSKLSFATTRPGSVKVEMFDIQGRLVRTILNESLPAGDHETAIDGRGQRGEKLASGVYFVRGVTPDGTFKNTITILK